MPQGGVFVPAGGIGQRRQSSKAAGHDQALRLDVPEVDGEAGLPGRELVHHYGETAASI